MLNGINYKLGSPPELGDIRCAQCNANKMVS